MPPVLIAFAGLPGVGKTTVARLVAKELGAAYLRLDTVEQALRELCKMEVGGEGYRLAYRVAADNLRIGLSAVADCVNPWALVRDEWAQTARDSGAAFLGVELYCSEAAELRLDTASLSAQDCAQAILRAARERITT
jgi:predicted kinase